MVCRDVRNEDLSGIRVTGCDLSGAVMRAVSVDGMEIDAPWLLEDRDARLLVNGVNVAPLVDQELDRRFPGRELRRADTAAGVREAWRAVVDAWAAAVARAQAMPPQAVDARVDGEWSFAETLRHLVMATDTWLGRALLGQEQPYHPIGVPNAEYALDGNDPSVFQQEQPGFDEVLQVRAQRQQMVTDFLAGLTDGDLATPRRNPHDPRHEETTLACLRTILEEEWEHLRYALRDLDRLGAQQAHR